MTIKVTTLRNGLRIATDTMKDAESVMVGAWVGVGTRHEPWSANGVAHLVEHMMFKGTRDRSAYALSAAIEKDGGMMNAHTTREETAYYARVLPENTEQALAIVSDMLRNSVFAPRELDRERKVIIQEIGRDLDSPEEHVFDLMQQLAYPKQKFGRPILGSAKVIAGLPRKAVVDYVRRYYNASNMVIVAAGRVQHDKFVALARKRFGSLPRGRASKQEKARLSSGDARLAKPIEQLHFILAFAGPGYRNPAVYPAQVLATLLGGAAASRLFQKVREKRGLVYTISANAAAYSDTGLFQIYAGTDPARVQQLIPVICNELRDVMRRGIKPIELARAKAQARADILMGQENVMRRAEVLGHQILAFGRPIPIKDILKKLMAVTRGDVQKIAKKLFATPPIVTALGPLHKLEDYRKIAQRLKN